MKLKEILMAIAIGILMFFVAFYGINILFPKPQYDDFCNISQPEKIIQTQETCTELNGTWYPQQIECIKAPCAQGYCDIYFKCNKDFEGFLKERARKVFFIALPLGIIIIAAGAFLFGFEVVGGGLMGGGVATLIYGSGAYWPYSENWIRFVISLIGLVILIWFSYFFKRRFEKKGKKKR